MAKTKYTNKDHLEHHKEQVAIRDQYVKENGDYIETKVDEIRLSSPEIGQLTNLTILWVWNNQLVGEIPQEVCDLIESNNLVINYILNGNNLINTCE